MLRRVKWGLGACAMGLALTFGMTLAGQMAAQAAGQGERAGQIEAGCRGDLRIDRSGPQARIVCN